MRLQFSLLFVLLLIAFKGPAQTLRGTIIDNRRVPLEETNIYHPKSQNHVHSNHKGEFAMKDVQKGDSLWISHLGFESKVLIVNDLGQPLIIQLYQKVITLEEVIIHPELDAINLFADINVKVTPVNSSQDILRKVPGLVIGQHAGGGKAEQLFLRGFDIDHGTDINITVDGMPVNMVSHAHGQGYADLHFLIPETIDKLNFGKGPYYAEQGNFATAGFVGFKTKEKLDQSVIKWEVGQFSTHRMLGMFNILNEENHHAYLASEYTVTDGPFESPQNFDRLNMFFRYSGQVNAQDKILFSASHFSSGWDASGQIPQRATEDGLISRFGAIDDTEGGMTSRSNLNVNYTKSISTEAFIKNTIYFTQYNFELFSNFTFFLNDPVYGDQIKQKEDRQLFGFHSEYNRTIQRNSFSGLFQGGLGFRNDQNGDVELSHTMNRMNTLNILQLGDIHETNYFGYINADFQWKKWYINPAIRVDWFQFNYNNHVLPFYQTQSQLASIISPKLNILFNPSSKMQLYVKTGKGFHSNDTRVVIAQEAKQILPAAWGIDGGAIFKPIPRMLINVAYWYLYLEQEFVYVGDEGVVEPSGRSVRKGVDLSLRYQPIQWLYYDLDMNYTLARAFDEEPGNDYIPLAPDFTITSGLQTIHPSGVHGGVQLRYIKNRPANEDNSIVAEGYHVVDFNVGYQWSHFDLGVSIQNVGNVDWNETQFATESRLYHEPESVEEIHFTPGTPFFLKGSLSYQF